MQPSSYTDLLTVCSAKWLRPGPAPWPSGSSFSPAPAPFGAEFLAPPPASELGSWPRPCMTSRNPLLMGLTIPPGWVGVKSGLQLWGLCDRGRASVWKAGARSHDCTGPQLFAVPRPLGTSPGAGRERSTARGGAGSGRAHVPELSEQRLQVPSVPDARSPRIRVWSRWLWEGRRGLGRAGLSRKALGHPGGAAGRRARPASAPNLA